MAERRMFSKTIIDSDVFLDMQISTQVLYFHLNMRADDDGFANNPKRILRMIGCSDDDLKILIAKQFIIPFESGVVAIAHWKIHNYIRSDRYKETVYQKEKSMLVEAENKIFKLGIPNVIPNDIPLVDQRYTQDSIDKISIEIDKERKEIGENSIELIPAKQESRIPYSEIIEYLNQRTGCNYKASTNKTKDCIKARFNEGFNIDDFKEVIDKKVNEWYGTEMQKYLRPETLFGNKFEGYLNQQQTRKIGFKEAGELMNWEEMYNV